MAKIPAYIVFLGILLAGCMPARAQENPEVKASVDKSQILIGEPVRFSIDMKSPMVSGNQLPSSTACLILNSLKKQTWIP